jgi:hypothetical protein
MDNSIQTASIDKEMITLKENSEDAYWSKTYGVSAEELKKEGNKIGLYDKIIEASFKHKTFNS